MSLALRAIINALALENDRVQRAYEAIAQTALPSQFGAITLEVTPSPQAREDARNLVFDPQGYGTGWTVTNGALNFTQEELPANFTRSVLATADAVGDMRVWTTATTSDSPGNVTYYAYAVLKTDSADVTADSLRLRIRKNSDGTIMATQEMVASSANGWTVMTCNAELEPNTAYRVEGFLLAPTAGDNLWMTGATLVAEVDPQEAFHGSIAGTSSHLYEWSGSRNNSPSIRRGQVLDLFGEREIERALNVAPTQWSYDERQIYIAERIKARNQSAGEVLTDLIVTLIQMEDPTFTSEGVRVREDYDNYEVAFEINYSPDGKLIDRIRQLIRDTAPCHLGFPGGDPLGFGLTFGEFRADISEAGDPL